MYRSQLQSRANFEPNVLPNTMGLIGVAALCGIGLGLAAGLIVGPRGAMPTTCENVILWPLTWQSMSQAIAAVRASSRRGGFFADSVRRRMRNVPLRVARLGPCIDFT